MLRSLDGKRINRVPHPEEFNAIQRCLGPERIEAARSVATEDAMPRLRMAVSCAIATNRERNATSKAIEPDSTQPASSVPPKPTASRSERHFCVKILGNLGTRAPLKRVLESRFIH